MSPFDGLEYNEDTNPAPLALQHVLEKGAGQKTSFNDSMHL